MSATDGVFATAWTGVDSAEEHIQVSTPTQSLLARLVRSMQASDSKLVIKGDDFVEFSNGRASVLMGSVHAVGL